MPTMLQQHHIFYQFLFAPPQFRGPPTPHLCPHHGSSVQKTSSQVLMFCISYFFTRNTVYSLYPTYQGDCFPSVHFLTNFTQHDTFQIYLHRNYMLVSMLCNYHSLYSFIKLVTVIYAHAFIHCILEISPYHVF